MAYTVEITDGSTTYTFDVTRVPDWQPTIETEYDQTKIPAVMTKRTDTLTLKGCTFRSATPSLVTDDWSTLKSQLFDATTPITAVSLKSGSTTLDSLTTTTHDQLMIASLEADGGAGHFASHWAGTIVVKAVKLMADADGVVKKVRRLSSSWDQHGFETRRLEVEMETAPGTSVTTKLIAETQALPSSKWTYTTGGPDGVDYTVEEDSEDTKGKGVSEMREQALTYPSGANEYTVQVTTEESGDDKTVRYAITAQSSTLARALAIVKASPAPSGYTRRSIQEDRTRNRATATYVVQDDATLRVKSWKLRVRGGGRELEGVRFPSIGGTRRPIPFRRPAGEYVFTETVTVTQRGNPYPQVPSVFYDDETLDTSVSSDDVGIAVAGSRASQNLYSRSVVRVHKVFGAPPSAATLLARMLRRPYPNLDARFAYELAEEARGG